MPSRAIVGFIMANGVHNRKKCTLSGKDRLAAELTTHITPSHSMCMGGLKGVITVVKMSLWQ